MTDPRDPVPPTIVRPAGEDVVPPTVVRVSEDAVPPTVVRDAGEPGAAAASGDAGNGFFPPELLADYEPVAVAGSGTEADVWHARRRGDGGDVAIKVHRAGIPVDADLLAHLDSPRFRRHVPELYGSGYVPARYGMAGWVAMEYLPATLDALMAAERTPQGAIPAARAREILAELAATIRFWQDPAELDRTPVDVKPDNFGVRRESPLELVVIDFGGVVRQTTTQRYGDVAAARAYMSPEGIIGMRHKASPWWSLGVIAYELATGTTRFRAADGRLLDDRILMSETVLNDVDLSEVPDERWRLLLAGLLTRNPDDRWGFDQVSSWLAGGSPPVARPPATAAGEGKARAPITFRGRSYWSPEDLAAALFESPAVAASWLQTDGDQLSRWIREDVADNLFDTRKYLTGIAARPARAPLAILAFGAAYARDLTPWYRGKPADAAGIAALCSPATADLALLSELFEQEVLPVAAQYKCAHGQCQPGGRCLILDGLAEDIPLITGTVERTARQLPAAGALTAAERDLARTTAVQLTLGAAIPGRPRVPELAVPNPASLVGGQLGGSWGGDPAWWAGVRQRARTADPGTVAGRADLTTAITLNGRVTRERTRLRLEARDRLRRQLASFRLAPPIALLSFLALVLLTWSAAVISQAISFGDSQLLSTMPQQAFLDHTLGRFASVRVFDLVPLIVLVAVASALPRLGRSVLAVGVTLLTAASLAASRTPAFPAAFAPGFVRGWLTSAAAGTHLLTGIAAVFIAPAAAIVCLAFAVRLSRVQYPPRPARWLAGIPAGIRHLVSGAITFVVLESVLWTVVVTRETLSDPSGSAFPGSLAADYQSGLLLACAVFAVVAAFPGAYGAHRVLVTGVIGATIVSIWSLPAALFRWLWHPVASSLLSGFASLWGTEAFWAAVVFAAPIAVAGLVVSARLRAG